MAKILIIDDSPTDVRVFTTLLEGAGHSVSAVSTAEEGVERVRADLARFPGPDGTDDGA